VTSSELVPGEKRAHGGAAPAPPEPAPSELADLARRALHELGAGAAGIGQVHLAIAERAFGASGPGATLARALHHAISTSVYGSLRGGARLAGNAAAAAVPHREVSEGPPGAALVAVVNGLIGDALEAERSPLAHPVRIVHGDGEPTGRVAVFVHGLMGTEHAWRLGGRERYGERLAREAGWTPLYVRYNTGRRISRNGHELHRLLSRELAAWPVPVERVALVGHSMGGLVARSACHCAVEEEAEWVRGVRVVVSLGTPHLGAPLEEGVHRLAHHLHRLPETRPLATFLRRRSGGIRDLRHGSLVDSDWEGRDPESLRAEAVAEVPLLEHATHCFVSACVTRSPQHPLGRLIGDLLVLGPSASGTSRRRSIGLDAANGLELGATHHLALLNHPRVYAQLREWLAIPLRTPDVAERTA
jgi:pimeloyl-ACP methyl ester carboxylesterase